MTHLSFSTVNKYSSAINTYTKKYNELKLKEELNLEEEALQYATEDSFNGIFFNIYRYFKPDAANETIKSYKIQLKNCIEEVYINKDKAKTINSDKGVKKYTFYGTCFFCFTSSVSVLLPKKAELGTAEQKIKILQNQNDVLGQIGLFLSIKDLSRLTSISEESSQSLFKISNHNIPWKQYLNPENSKKINNDELGQAKKLFFEEPFYRASRDLLTIDYKGRKRLRDSQKHLYDEVSSWKQSIKNLENSQISLYVNRYAAEQTNNFSYETNLLMNDFELKRIQEDLNRLKTNLQQRCERDDDFRRLYYG